MKYLRGYKNNAWKILCQKSLRGDVRGGHCVSSLFQSIIRPLGEMFICLMVMV